MRIVKNIVVRLCRALVSFWLLFAVLLAVAVTCLWHGLLPGPTQLERMAGEIHDPKFRNWYSTVQSEKEKVALRTALDAYGRTFGSAVWARHVEQELDGTGVPRFFDLAEFAMSIGNGEDRIAFAEAHKDVYSLMVSSGSSELAADYVARLRELRKMGGREWVVARSNPIAVVVYATVGKNSNLWTWYLDNRNWVDDYVMAMCPDLDSDNPEGVLDNVIEEFRRRPKVYRALRDEVMSWQDGKEDAASSGDLDAYAFLSYAMGTVSLYGDMFEVLCEAGVPFGEALDVFANNIDDLKLDTPDDSRETGIELVNLYRSHKSVWDAASVPGGNGAVRYFREVPAYAETVLASFGEAGILPFLMQNYSDSNELLYAASEAIYRYEAVGWAVLANFAGNGEFKRALVTKGVGHLVVPYVALKGGGSEAVSQCINDPRWVKRYLNADGSFKPETETIIEAMPFVGGIATVVKHKWHGEPVTMGEVGWAAFDVVDDVITTAAIVGATVMTSGAGTAPAVAAAAAKEAVVETAKTAGKVTIKQAGKQLAKQSAKAGAKYAAKRGSVVIVRNGVEKVAGREAKVLARRALVHRMAQTAGRAGSWTVRMAGKPVRFVTSPLTKTAAAWRKLPPAARVRILKASSVAMLFVAISYRTLPKFPGAMHETLKACGAHVGNLVREAINGVADGFVEAVRASIGIRDETSLRPFRIALGVLALILALYLLARHYRTKSHVLA